MLLTAFLSLPFAGKLAFILLVAAGLVYGDAFLVICLMLILALISAIRDAVRPGAFRRWMEDRR